MACSRFHEDLFNVFWINLNNICYFLIVINCIEKSIAKCAVWVLRELSRAITWSNDAWKIVAIALFRSLLPMWMQAIIKKIAHLYTEQQHQKEGLLYRLIYLMYTCAAVPWGAQHKCEESISYRYRERERKYNEGAYNIRIEFFTRHLPCTTDVYQLPNVKN